MAKQREKDSESVDLSAKAQDVPHSFLHTAADATVEVSPPKAYSRPRHAGDPKLEEKVESTEEKSAE